MEDWEKEAKLGKKLEKKYYAALQASNYRDAKPRICRRCAHSGGGYSVEDAIYCRLAMDPINQQYLRNYQFSVDDYSTCDKFEES